MSAGEDSKVLILLLPDLFPANELRKMLEERCSQIGNLGSLSKERLVGLFRKIIVPFPQRHYRSNRRGKMLIARRIKFGLEERKARDTEGEGSPYKKHRAKCSDSSRIKPPPSVNSSSKINVDGGVKSESYNNKYVSNDGRRYSSEDKVVKKIELKRQSETFSPSETENKRRRTAIKWP